MRRDAFKISGHGLPNTSCESRQTLEAGLRAARREYEEAVADFLNAVRSFSDASLDFSERTELLKTAREREKVAFARYKRFLDQISMTEPTLSDRAR